MSRTAVKVGIAAKNIPAFTPVLVRLISEVEGFEASYLSDPRLMSMPSTDIHVKMLTRMRPEPMGSSEKCNAKNSRSRRSRPLKIGRDFLYFCSTSLEFDVPPSGAPNVQ